MATPGEREIEPPAAMQATGPRGPAGAHGWETYTPGEVESVLAEYQVGRVERAQEYRRGSRSAPKLKIKATSGTYLLKRRSIRRHPLLRIRFAQSLQVELDAQGFPVAGLVPLRATGETLLVREDHVYELFRFVEGSRYDKSARAAARSGECLARLHRFARAVDASQAPPASFHSSGSVRTALHRLGQAIMATERKADAEKVEGTRKALQALYERACEEVDDLGFKRLSPGVVHGDWHPGNLIFRDGVVAAVIDFDSARSEPRITEVANGMLQFSLRGEPGTSPLEWPSDLDASRLQGFLHGYLAAADRPLTLDERTMLPWFMIEAMIAESAIPVANQGSFAELAGSSFMDLVRRKCEWVRQHRKRLAAL